VRVICPASETQRLRVKSDYLRRTRVALPLVVLSDYLVVVYGFFDFVALAG
jgi:hypothetical protein